MSRSEPTLQNPAKRFFDWSAKQGQIRYYDKSKGEKGENVDVQMPFRFLVLDQLSQIGGGKKIGRGDSKEFVGYFSNAVRKFDINKEKFVVRDRNGIVGEGTYHEVKKITGAKLIAGLYIAFYDDDKVLQIGHLKLHGSAMGEWFEFTKGRNVETGVISISRGEEMKDEDDRVYYHPKFVQTDTITDETEAKAVALDQALQSYLSVYFAKDRSEEQNYQSDDDDAPEFSGSIGEVDRQLAKAAAQGFGTPPELDDEFASASKFDLDSPPEDDGEIPF